MNKITFNQEAKQKLIAGIEQIKKSVTTTLGPGGRNVIFTDEHGEVRSTKDGVSVAKMIRKVEDPVENMGIQMLKQAAIKTANEAGDGTTTATLLASEFILDGFKVVSQGINPVEVKKGMEEAVSKTIEYLQSIHQDISLEEQLRQIATISANGDVEIGTLISVALEKVGREGVVTIEESKTGESYLETVEGMQFDRGYKSPYLVTDNASMSCVLNKPYVLIYEKKLTQIKELLPLLDYVSKQDRSLLIIAEDIEHETLATLIVNKMRGIIKVCAVKAPDFGERRTAIMHDIAILTNGQVVSPDKAMKLEKFEPSWLGECLSANITKEETTIIDGKGDPELIEKRLNDIKNQIESCSSLYEKEQLQNRLAKMSGGVAIVYVGAHTEIEMKEKKDRVDDALHATKAAIEEGILPGGGVALLNASLNIRTSLKGNELIGFYIVKRVLSKPFEKILSNMGLESYDHKEKISKHKSAWFGFNPKTEKYGDMLQFGILDPLKVTRCALENAVSVASTILLTDCVIYTEEKADAAENVEQPFSPF